ncbi:unnamed protein product [Caenorhabditis angaria]|uniref:Uncharacterized protein n=1 Tax=Caenorhabditis angaria TaxID=860376 RepID=A0A9P1IQM1_9PELO|nr:unnamed protein product [Caenorhabditis angaria]
MEEKEAVELTDFYHSVIFFCDKYSLDKRQVFLGLILTLLFFIFLVCTIIAWKRYSPIIQELLIKESIEKAKTAEKNKEE